VRLTPEEQRRELKRAELRGWLARLFAPASRTGAVRFAVATGCAHQRQLPTPAKVWQAAITLFSDPFYQKGPNDQGIGWNVLVVTQACRHGFRIGSARRHSLGFVIGRFPFFNQMAAPLISLLKPVSPLAWLPIGLLLFKAANPRRDRDHFHLFALADDHQHRGRRAADPQEYSNVAKVLQLSEWKVLTRILFPAVLPFMLTGVRLSIGIAWLVIVARRCSPAASASASGLGRMEQPERAAHHHRDRRDRRVGLLLEATLILIARRSSINENHPSEGRMTYESMKSLDIGGGRDRYLQVESAADIRDPQR